MTSPLDLNVVRGALAEVMGNADFLSLPADAVLRENGLDSLAHFKLLLFLENKSGISIHDEDFSFSKLGTLSEILRVFESTSS